MQRAKKICAKIGCNALISYPNKYCSTHSFYLPIEAKERFKALDARKTPEQIKFYTSPQWTQVSKMFRSENPLCNRCKKNGKITQSVLVHHNPDLNYLLKNDLSPLNFDYLEALCHNCHQKELSLKRFTK